MEQLITEQTAQRLASALERVADVLERGGVEKEAQLDRMESQLSAMARGQWLQPVTEQPSESFTVAMMGGVNALKALNRKRAAEQRRKKK